MDRVPTEIWVPYTAVVELPGRRGRVRATRFSRETFRIARVADDDREVAVDIDLGGGRRLAWRDHGGSYWRPVLTEGLAPVQEPGSRGWDVHPEAWRGVREWTDYPFTGWRPVKGRSPHEPLLGTIVSDDRAVRVKRARQVALNLALFGGVLHKRAPLPAWMIEDIRKAGPGAARLNLVLPDLLAADATGLEQVRDPGLGLFPVGRMWDALDVSRALVPDRPGHAVVPATPPGARAVMFSALRPCSSTTLGLLGLHRRASGQLRESDRGILGEAVSEAKDRAWRAASALRFAVYEPTFVGWPWYRFYPDPSDGSDLEGFQPAYLFASDEALGPAIAKLGRAMQDLHDAVERHRPPGSIDLLTLRAAGAVPGALLDPEAHHAATHATGGPGF